MKNKRLPRLVLSGCSYQFFPGQEMTKYIRGDGRNTNSNIAKEHSELTELCAYDAKFLESIIGKEGLTHLKGDNI